MRSLSFFFLFVLVILPSSILSGYKIEIIGDSKKWTGCPDPNYVWEGDRLVWERTVKDENGEDVTIKTYKKPIEIIANFKPASKVYGIEGNIRRKAVEKFGGALKGFVWLDKVNGGGEVILPFTAEYIFIARGDRLNPVLTGISTDTSADNYYEIVEGKTHVYVKAFSGIGGAAGSPPTLIAHYKFNENTSGDSAELVVNGDFAAWTNDNPDSWTVLGEGGGAIGSRDPEISQVATGQGHSSAGGESGGMCNIFSTGGYIAAERTFNTVIGRRYRLSIKVEKITGGIYFDYKPTGGVNTTYTLTSSGIYTFTFVAESTSEVVRIRRVAATDITVDNISCKLCAVEDSSGNDHDGLAQQDTSAISVAGKIITAFDFTPNDYIEIPDHDDFTPAGTPFSISAWVYMREATHFDIASKGVLNINGEWEYHVHAADHVKIRFFDEDVDDCFIGSISDDALTTYEGSWIHLVATYDGGILSSGIKHYLNGNLLDSSVNQNNNQNFNTVVNLDGAVEIGTDGTHFADGVIDNVAFYSVELTQDEVNILYNNGSGTEIPAELDSKISPRRGNLSPLPLRRRWEF